MRVLLTECQLGVGQTAEGVTLEFQDQTSGILFVAPLPRDAAEHVVREIQARLGGGILVAQDIPLLRPAG